MMREKRNKRLLRFLCAAMTLLLLPLSAPVAASEQPWLLPGGITFGARLCCSGVLVVSFTGDRDSSPAMRAGLRENDLITAINGENVTSAEHLTGLVDAAAGKTVSVRFTRNGREGTVTCTPEPSPGDGRYRIGVTVRDSAAGIGTVTYIMPDCGAFGGLGHGICNASNGELLPMSRGSVCGVILSGVKKGASGSPGELKGSFGPEKLGNLAANTSSGVFGLYATIPDGLKYQRMRAADPSEVTQGKATILSTLDSGGVCEYRVEITEIFEPRGANDKCFSLRVTDERLLEKTGGIIQGMSGSPILQNGKIVGAVTHVMVNDPTAGYGIFVVNMLDAMPELLR